MGNLTTNWWCNPHHSIKDIDYIESKHFPYHIGNAVKYLSRAGKKDPAETITDLRKAVWYINRYGIVWTKGSRGIPRDIAGKAYIDKLFDIFGWHKDYRYKLYGCVYRDGVELACIFSDIDASVYIKKEDYLSATGVDAQGLLMNTSGKRIKAVTGDLGTRFGRGFYEEWNRDGHMTEEQWQTRIEARLCEAGERLKITPYSELESFIRQELGELFEEVKP